jgi:hypothetical protein
VDFVLTYPETVTGKRTTPRSLVQFFNQIADIKDLQESIDLVNVLAASSLDIETATAFTAFIHESLAKLPSTQDILDAKDPNDFIDKIKALSKPGEGKRVDLIATIVTRLLIELGRKEADLPKSSGANLIALLTSDVLPGDLKFSLHRDLSVLTKSSGPGGRIAEEVCKDPGVAKIVLKAM